MKTAYITNTKCFDFTEILRKMATAHSTVWKLRKFTFTLFWQKFRETNVFTKEIDKYLVNLTKHFLRHSDKNKKSTLTEKISRQINYLLRI